MKMVVEPLKPKRGGFLRPFGCGWFIREYLLGNGPYGSPKIDPNRIDGLFQKYFIRLPYKAGCTYHSFITYFSMLQKLGWAEFTGKEEPSQFQDNYPEGQPRKYFRLTKTVCYFILTLSYHSRKESSLIIPDQKGDRRSACVIYPFINRSIILK
jgi:hypothetical protein